MTLLVDDTTVETPDGVVAGAESPLALTSVHRIIRA
jgi:hypothetical protein